MTPVNSSDDMADSNIPANANRVDAATPTARPSLDDNSAVAELLQTMRDLSAQMTRIAQALAECQAVFRRLTERLGVTELAEPNVGAVPNASVGSPPAPVGIIASSASRPVALQPPVLIEELELDSDETPVQQQAVLFAQANAAGTLPTPAPPVRMPASVPPTSNNRSTPAPASAPAVTAVPPTKARGAEAIPDNKSDVTAAPPTEQALPTAAAKVGRQTPTQDLHPIEVFNRLIRWIHRNQTKQQHFAPMATRTVNSVKQKHLQLTMFLQQYDDNECQPHIDHIMESLLEDLIQLDELISQEKPESAAARTMQKIRDGLVKLICDYGPYVEIRAVSGDSLADWPQPLDDYLVAVSVPHPTIPRGQVVRTIRPGYQLRKSGEVVQLAIVHVSA